jgi:hypothetical protein
MANTKIVAYGIGAVVLSFVIAMVAVGTGADTIANDRCEELRADGDIMQWEEEGCEKIEDDYSTSGLWGVLMCCVIMPIGIAVAVYGYKADNPNAVGAVVVQQVPYMVPAQPTYAPPVAPQPMQPSAADVELELKQRRMSNVDTLRREGRFMEAALEAEMAGEYRMAGELRSQAEQMVRQDNVPESPQEDHYLVFLTTVMADGFLSVEEEQLLEEQRNKLGITWDTHVRMLGELGYQHEQLKQFQQAKMMEESGRFIESAAIYESLGNLDKAQMLRMKAKIMEGGNAGGHTTYNISDSVVQGGLDDN